MPAFTNVADDSPVKRKVAKRIGDPSQSRPCRLKFGLSGSSISSRNKKPATKEKYQTLPPTCSKITAKVNRKLKDFSPASKEQRKYFLNKYKTTAAAIKSQTNNKKKITMRKLSNDVTEQKLLSGLKDSVHEMQLMVKYIAV